MAKLTLTTLATLRSNSALTALNDNLDAIEEALENTLSRDGKGPNNMSANLDMNSKRILNLPEPTSDLEPMRKLEGSVYVSQSAASALAAAASAAQAQALIDSAALDFAPIGHTHTAAQINDSSAAGRALLTAADVATQKAALGYTKTDVGLGNVDDTSDLNKPISIAAQTALDLKVDTSLVAASNGIATLGADGKVPAVQLPVTGSYSGTWNATTNTPTITSSSGLNGQYYIVATAGTTSINGEASWAIGDQIRFNGTIWQKIANAAAVSSVAGKTGIVTLVKADVGLGNVDNTADTAKPISTATQTALDTKAPLNSPAFTGTPTGITKAHVGLGSVDNTSDANKPVSTAQQTALNDKANLAIANTFTAQQVVSVTTAGTNVIRAVATESGAAAGPLVDLSRSSTSPAASDSIGQLRFTASDSGGVNSMYAALQAVIVDPTDTQEKGRLLLQTALNGVNNTRATIEAGFQVGTPTDGDKGFGSVNAQSIYKNGVAVATVADLSGGVAIFNVTDAPYNAAGDGVTNDTAAIQAALNAANTVGGGIVYFPRGTYAINDTLDVYNNTIIRGEGRELSWIKPMASMSLTITCFKNVSVGLASSARLGKNITIEYMSFDGINRVYPRWLQNPQTSALITDPEADYYDATLRPAARIGNPAWGANTTSVAAAQTPAGISGNLALVGGSSTFSFPRKVSITSAGNLSALTFTVTGTAQDGSAKVVAFTGPNANTVTSANYGIEGVFKTITQISWTGGALGAAVSAGVLAYDIDSVIALNRRNPGYSVNGSCIRMDKVEHGLIRECVFINHQAMCILDQGCLNLRIWDCRFGFCGKDDDAYPAIYVNCYGSWEAPGASFADSKDSHIARCHFHDLERNPLLFGATHGGIVEDCVAERVGEAGFFFPKSLGVNGGRTTVRNNYIKDVRMTDIASCGIETNGPINIDFLDNWIEESDAEALNAMGGVNFTVRGGRYINCFKNRLGKYPYGPFSERYGFGRGEAHLAGLAISSAQGYYFKVGSLSTKGTKNCRFQDLYVKEDRVANFPYLFSQTKSGVNNISEDILIEKVNVRDCPAAMVFFHTGVADVWTTDMDITIRDNPGHVSYKGTRMVNTFTAADNTVKTFTPGFRPSRIDVTANVAGGGIRNWRGTVIYEPDTISNILNTAAGVAMSASAGAGTFAQTNSANDFIRIVDDAGTTVFLAEMNGWTELGFKVSVITSTVGCNATFYCFP